MAMTPTPVPQYPNVPKQPGVPPLLRSPAQAPVFKTILLVADVISILRLFLGPQWGIFTSGGAPVAIASSVLNVEFRREARIPTYPQEQGAFQSYNKVQMPYDVRVRFAVSESSSFRSQFLQAINSASLSTDLYTVVTPDANYKNMNIVHYDYRRDQREGVSQLVVDVWLQEVRVAKPTQFSNTKTPAGAAQTNGGTVQGSPKPPTVNENQPSGFGQG